jgi:hypothetical protein
VRHLESLCILLPDNQHDLDASYRVEMTHFRIFSVRRLFSQISTIDERTHSSVFEINIEKFIQVLVLILHAPCRQNRRRFNH